jgi:hypothetical protein
MLDEAALGFEVKVSIIALPAEGDNGDAFDANNGDALDANISCA